MGVESFFNLSLNFGGVKRHFRQNNNTPKQIFMKRRFKKKKKDKRKRKGELLHENVQESQDFWK